MKLQPERNMLFLLILMPMLSHINGQALPNPPIGLQISDITSTSVRIMWKYTDNPGVMTNYVIQYKSKYQEQFTEISGLATKFYIVTGLRPSRDYDFQVVAVNMFGRGPPTEPSHVETTRNGCGDFYNSSSGTLKYPHDIVYNNNQKCTWIIKAADLIKITFVNIDIADNSTFGGDYLTIRDGESIASTVIGKFTGNNVPRSVQTRTNAAHLQFTSDDSIHGTGFELLWEPGVETFYQIPMHSDYEVRLNFSANPQPTNLEWSYGANFQEMPKIIQIPSDNGKFSASVIDLGNGNYQTLLGIAGITEEVFETKFKFHVANEISESFYRVILSEFPHPPSSLQISDIMPTSVRITWDYNVNPDDMSKYVIQYKPRKGTHDYTEISGIENKLYTIRGLTPSTEYEIRVLAVHKIGRGPPSDTSYVKTSTTGCGAEFNSSSGMIRRIVRSNRYNEKCTWIIMAEDRIKITFASFDTTEGYVSLNIRDGESIESKVLHSFSGSIVPKSFQTSTNAAYLIFASHSGRGSIKSGFELHWELAVETFYQVLLHSDHELKLNFSANPQPTDLKWSYGANFQEMPNLIQIPSDNGKFSTSLIDLDNGNYQAVLRIAGITEEDLKTKFKLHVANEISDTYYRVILSAFPDPPSSLQISNIKSTSVRITWNYVNPGDILYYVIQYKPRNTDLNYTEISGIVTTFYTVIGLIPFTEYKFHVLAVHKIGRGPPSEPAYVTTHCGGEYNSSSGRIRHPFSGDKYQNDEECIWIIRAADRIKITFVRFDTQKWRDYLYIRDGDSIESNILGQFSGNTLPDSVQISTNAAHLLFKSNLHSTRTGFELYWEPLVETFYQALPHSNYEVRFNFSANPQPTALEWSYGANFQDMPNIIQVPSDNGKFSTSLIDLEDGNYQAILRITGITEEDIETKFKLRVSNEIGETYYSIILSAFPSPPSSFQFSNITATSVQISWNYNVNPGDLSYYVIQYKPRNTDQNYAEIIFGIDTMFYTVIGMMPATEYEFHILAGNKIGRGPLSEPSYVTTNDPDCGGEYNSSTGTIRHPFSSGTYQNSENCTWIIRTAEHINITFVRFHIGLYDDYLYVRDGDSIESNVLHRLSGDDIPWPFQTSTNAAHLFFTSDSYDVKTGFELYWDPAVETFYQVLLHGNHEVRLNFSANPQPTDFKWSYGANFQEMPNFIQIPSYNGKFSTSLIDLDNGNYQAVLRITGITEEDLATKFKLHVANEISETYYRVILSALPHPPLSLQFSDITPTSMRIMWNCNVTAGDISYYVIQYKPAIKDQDYKEISGLDTNFYNFRGLEPARYKFQVLAVNKYGRGPPSKPSYVSTSMKGCGGEYDTNSGKIRYPSTGDKYYNNKICTWIIRAADLIKITFVSFDISDDWDGDYLTIRDGESLESNLLGKFTGDNVPSSVQTSTNAAHLLFTSDDMNPGIGFELYWEPGVETFYQIPMHSDYEVRFNFSTNPQPTALEWSYGANFQKMSNRIQIPSDDGKFSTSLIDLENGNYQALLRITAITEEDLGNKYKLHVANEIGENNYRVTLSEFPRPPLRLQISNIMPTSVRITWTHNVNPEDISYYVVQYKPRYDQDYTEISGIGTKSYTVRGLTPSTEYIFHVLSANNIGHGLPSDPSYITTSDTDCGGEYNSSSGIIRHPLSGGNYQNNEKCTWIIRAAIGTINIKFVSFDIDWGAYLFVRDGESIESNVLSNISGASCTGDHCLPRPIQTRTNAAHLFFTSNGWNTKTGFELHWEFADAPIQTFYGVHVHSDYEVRVNFSANPQPTSLEWFYGPNFQEMPNLIQIPSDNGKFSTSLIDLKNGNYQAILIIAGVTLEESESMFKLHVANEIGEADYKIIFSGCPEGFIMSSGSKQCFKIFMDKRRNWKDANTKCEDEGLKTAKPTDAVAVSLREVLFDTYGDAPVWLDTCGEGDAPVWLDNCNDWTKFVWVLEDPEMSRDKLTNDHCLALLVAGEVSRDYPVQPYAPLNCSHPLHSLCQV